MADYEPVSRALTAYEIAYRDRTNLQAQARRLRRVVNAALTEIRHDPATGPTAEAKTLLVQALLARRRALDLVLSHGLSAYLKPWNESVVYARQALTKLQDIRDRARLIPLPEDSIS